MSFDNEIMSLVHLVTYPSIWLPPHDTTKILIVGASEAKVGHLVDSAQKQWPQINWAFYYVPDLDIAHAEQLDWLLINSHHVHGVVAFVTTAQDLACAQSMQNAYVVDESCVDFAQKLLSNADNAPISMAACVYNILDKAGKLPTT